MWFVCLYDADLFLSLSRARAARERERESAGAHTIDPMDVVREEWSAFCNRDMVRSSLVLQAAMTEPAKKVDSISGWSKRAAQEVCHKAACHTNTSVGSV